MNVFWILPLIILFGGAIIIALLGRFTRKVTPGWNMTFAIIANLCLLAALGLIIAFANGLPVNSTELTLVLPGRTLENSLYTVFRLDNLTWWFMLVFVVLGSIVAIYSIKYMDKDSRLDRYYLLLLILVGGMIGVVMSGDLLTLFIFWEGMSISSYVLVAFRKDEPEPIEAGIKYLFMSAFGSVILLFGMSLLYGITGTLNIAAIGSALTTQITTGSGFSGIHVVIIICLIVGFGVKAAIVPLHLWLPDAHPAAPSGISAMLSGVVIMTGMFAMTNTLTSFFGGSVGAPGNNLKVVGYVLLWISVITMIVGNLMALVQKDLKRMLAFSTILNVGFILFGLSMTLTTISADIVELGVQGSYFHIFTHSLGKGLAFLCAGAILYRFHDRNIDRLEGIGQKMPITTFAMTIALLSLAGVPPLPGFWSKLNIVVAAVTSGDIQFRIGVVFFLLSSVVSVVYYLILLQKFWFKPAGEHLNDVKETPIEIVIPLVVIVLMMVIVGVLPGTFENLANNAAIALLG
ncbi:MAG TPA: proton-conducting transporter membrane subunit [Candidatus Bathyarchaeia archaeon]|nr:proton-conducting transporter membrane subunit [Candidatus Bathyarchaeia archaeon]